MKFDLDALRVRGGRKLDLRKWAAATKRLYRSEAHYQELLAADVETLSKLQRLLYASNGYSILLVFQGMDAAGKDGAIGHVLTGVNPQGCEVHSFKQPSANELEHDFLWRTTWPLPARGRIGVFNRSYYEEVLVVRVHPEMLKAEGLPQQQSGDRRVWKGRYRSIIAFEKHLHRSGTIILKFFLHLSKEEQRKRFLERIDDPDKNWKLSHSDIAERKFWKQYERAYEECLSGTSSKSSPWHVIPADDKNNARLIISRVVIDALQRLNLTYPAMTAARRRELQAIRKQLER